MPIDLKCLERVRFLMFTDLRRRAWAQVIGCASMALVLPGCFHEHHKQLGTDALIRELSPENEAKAVDFSHAEFVDGELREEDKRAIAAALGRIQGMDHKVEKVWVFTQDCNVAVRVQIKNHLIYLVKPLDSTWQMAGVSELSF
jgi:hypothetical protein